MKAVLCEKFAPLDQLVVKEVPDPEAGPGQVVVDVCAAGVNYPDGLLVKGLYQMKPEFPFTPGTEVAGTVSAVGEGVTSVVLGDRVLGFCFLGGYAEKVVTSASSLMSLPDDIADEEAAGLITAHATAHHALKQRASINPEKPCWSPAPLVVPGWRRFKSARPWGPE
jgi:NADPH2:quinone reductase